MKTGFTMDGGIVNWPEIKTRRLRTNGPSASFPLEAKQGRERHVLDVVANNLERLKEQLVQTIQRL
jgi:hypothetical protein